MAGFDLNIVRRRGRSIMGPQEAPSQHWGITMCAVIAQHGENYHAAEMGPLSSQIGSTTPSLQKMKEGL